MNDMLVRSDMMGICNLKDNILRTFFKYAKETELKQAESKVKGKVKVTLVQALRLCTGRTAHRGSRGIALLFHDHGT